MAAYQLLGIAPSSDVVGEILPLGSSTLVTPAMRLKWYTGMTVGEPSDDAEGSYCSRI